MTGIAKPTAGSKSKKVLLCYQPNSIKVLSSTTKLRPSWDLRLSLLCSFISITINTFQSNWRMKITCFEWDQKIWAKTLPNTNFTNNLQIRAESYLPRFQTYWINSTISTEVQKKTEKLIFSADHLWHLLYVIQNYLLCVIQKRLFVRYLILRKIKMCIIWFLSKNELR